MADYSMEDEKWNGRKATLAAWFEANPSLALEEDREALANGFFRIGDNHPENRMRYWTSISTLFAGLSNTPLGPGRTSNMSVGQKSDLDLYIEEYTNDQIEAYNTDKHLQATARTHGKSGGQFYHLMSDSASVYAEKRAKVMRAFLIKAFNAAYKGDEEATYGWPTVPSEDGESQILDFNDDGVPTVQYRGADEEE